MEGWMKIESEGKGKGKKLRTRGGAGGSERKEKKVVDLELDGGMDEWVLGRRVESGC